MKRKFLATCLLVCAGVLTVMAIAADLNGKWVGKTQMDGNDIPLTYNFKVDGEKLTGTAESPYGVSAVDNGKVKGNDFSFTTTVNGMEIGQVGKLYTDSVGIDIDVNGATLHAHLLRSK